MSKVQEYLKNKKIKELGLPKMYVVKSDPSGVQLPIERQVIEVKERVAERILPDKRIPINRYVMEGEYPYEVDIVQGDISGEVYGHGSGFGDLWSWTYYCTLSKDGADEYYKKEVKRVFDKYVIGGFFSALGERLFKCDVSIPEFRDVKAEIIAVDFMNIDWKPVKVRYLEPLKHEVTEFENNLWAEGQHAVKKMVPYREDWVMIKWLKNYTK